MQSKSCRIINVRVTPRSSRPRIEEALNGSFRVYLKSAPVKGKANSELIVMMADYLGVPKNSIAMIRGSCSRDKILKVQENG
jgi:uncharacterized protein (TIGR00251 family)